jgi:hypothetical protein
MSSAWLSQLFGYADIPATSIFCFLTSPLLHQEMTPDAEIVNVRFTKSVIASKAAFTYEEAQIRKDDP